MITPCSGYIALTYARYALRRQRTWRDAMNATGHDKHIDCLMRLAQTASITVGIIILTEYIGRHWRMIAVMLGFGS